MSISGLCDRPWSSVLPGLAMLYDLDSGETGTPHSGVIEPPQAAEGATLPAVERHFPASHIVHTTMSLGETC